MSKDHWIPVEWEHAEDLRRMDLTSINIHRTTSPYYEGVRYAVRDASFVLSVDGEWRHEPLPSSRDDKFYELFRFKSFDAAVKAAEAQRGKRRVWTE